MITFRKISLLIFVIILGILFSSAIDSATAASNFQIFIPLIIKQDQGSIESQVALGIYPDNYWNPNDLSGALDYEFGAVNDWSGKQVSIAGIFHSINQHDDYIIDDMFTDIWNSGYTPFVNIYFDTSVSSIAAGEKDADIRAWARKYKIFAQDGSRMAFLAPMQEMNGNWTPYGSSNPDYFKAAFQRIHQIFAQEGVPSNSVKWVFAPNGESSIGWPGFEAYYPGDDLVDVVGFSSYNYGYYPSNPYKKWETPDEIFTPFIRRMRVMAPGKPIFISQTGTTAYGPNGYSTSLKNQWLEDAYTLLTNQGIFGVIYYNANNNYDWAFYRYDNTNIRFDGYREGISYPHYQYFEPLELMSLLP